MGNNSPPNDSETEAVTSNDDQEVNPDEPSLESRVEKWLQASHQDELDALKERPAHEPWITLSVESLREECGDEVAQDALFMTRKFESGYKYFAGLKSIILDLVDKAIETANLRILWTDIPDKMLVGEPGASETHQLIAVEGQIEQASQVNPVISEAVFLCLRCGTEIRLAQSDEGGELKEPHECPGCERKGPFRLAREESEYVDYQEVRLQTPPEHAHDGVEDIKVLCRGPLAGEHTGDLGRTAVVQGYLTVEESQNVKQPLLLHAHDIEIVDQVDMDVELYRDEIEKYQKMDDPISNIIADKFLPQIYAPEDSTLRLLEEAILLQACSAARLATKRGSIHILTVGDPGTGKTQIAEFAAEIVPRSEVASTRSTGVGLTVAAVHDEMSGWTIRSGAIVRANKGVLVIDEIDKFDDNDLDDLHYPMESQQVTADVADQSATLPAETAVLATANPKYDRFDEFEAISDQIDFAESLLSRFDLILTMTDDVDKDEDSKMADAIIGGFVDAIQEEVSAESEVEEKPNIGFLRAWISESLKIIPDFDSEAMLLLEEFFVKIRGSNMGNDDAIPLTPRQLEGLVRLSIASARARHSDVVTEADAERAIRLLNESLKDVGMDPETGEYDADLVETGSSKSMRDRDKIIRSVIDDLCKEFDQGAPIAEVVETCVDRGFEEDRVEHAIDRLKQQGEIYKPASDRLRTG